MTSPVPDAFRTHDEASDLADELWTAIAVIRDESPRRPDDADTGDIVAAVMDIYDRVIARVDAAARAEGAAEALRAAEEFARRRESELYQDYRAPHLSALTRRRIEGEQHGWGHAADNLAYRAALSAPTTTEGDPT